MERRHRKQAINIGMNLLSSVVVVLISGVIFSIDRRLPEPNETAKFIQLFHFMPIISVSGFVLAIVNRNIRFTWLDLFSLLFLLYYLFSVYTKGTDDPRLLLLPAVLCTIYVTVRASVSGRSSGLLWMVLAILSVSILELLIGLKQIFGYASSNHFRYIITGSFFNPGPFGGYVAFIFALSLSCLICLRKKCVELLYAVKQHQFKKLIDMDVPLFFVALVACFLSFILLPSTMSRSAWMAVGVVSTVAFINAGVLSCLRLWFSNRLRLLIPSTLAASIAVIAVLFGIYTLKKDSADSRLFSWQISAKVITANPVTGVGPGYFGGAYAKQQALFFEEHPESKYMCVADCPTYAFNEYLQIGTELGLVGLALFAMVIIIALSNIFKKPNPFHYGLLALLIFAFTSYPFHLVPLLVLLVISIAAQENKFLPGRFTGSTFFVLLSFAAFVVWMGSRQLVNDYTQALIEWRRLKTLYGMEVYDTDGYKEIYSDLKHDHKFLFEYGHSLNKVGEYEKSNEVLQTGTQLSNDPMFHNVMGNNFLAMKIYDHAEKSYTMAYRIVPSRIYPLYLLAKLYIEQEDHNKALEMCRKVLAFSPKIHSTAVTELKAEIEELMYHLENKDK